MNRATGLLRWAGILALFWAGSVVVFLLHLNFLGPGLRPLIHTVNIYLIVSAGLAVAGGVFALMRKASIAPWLIIAALVLFVVLDPVMTQLAGGPSNWSYWWFYLTDFSFAWSSEGPLQTVIYVMPVFGLVALAVAAFLSAMAFARRNSSVPSQRGGGTMDSGAMSSVPAGWYADPQGNPVDRYWDGEAWTEQSRPRMTPVSRGGPMVVGASRNGMGTAALVMGILGILILPIVFSLLAIIFGSVGIGRVNRGEATNKGVAVTGLVLGIIGMILGLLVGVALLAS